MPGTSSIGVLCRRAGDIVAAGRVDQHVDAAELRDRGSDDGLRPRHLCHIAERQPDTGLGKAQGDLGACLLAPLRAAAVDDDRLGAGGEHGLGAGPADARGAASDHRRLARERTHGHSILDRVRSGAST